MDQAADSGTQTVREAGEHSVLRRVLAQLGAAEAARLGPGDDCAVLGLRGELVVSSDTMIEGPDFRLEWHTGFELGQKLAATNFSDIAAMGARPIALTVSLAVPSSTPVSLLEDIGRGLDASCRELAPGCGVVGGDLGSAPVLFAAITALGDLEGRPAVKRSGARSGDTVAYAGDLGLAGMGLALLFEEMGNRGAEDAGQAIARLRDEHSGAIRAQLTPAPPVEAGSRASAAGATSMIDVSDGLSLDAARIGLASGVSIDLDSALLVQGFASQHGERVSVEAMLTGGEDHGLLATFPPGTALPDGFEAIGAVGRGSGVTLDGRPFEPRGWDPYRA